MSNENDELEFYVASWESGSENEVDAMEKLRSDLDETILEVRKLKSQIVRLISEVEYLRERLSKI